ncbi:MAG: hypothetical protein V3V00_01785 [Saprospiraceae bacterium]
MKSTFFLLCISSLFWISGCQEKNPSPNPELLNIELLRGDLVLCSGKSFGEVRFSVSCKYSVREIFNLAVSLLHSFEYQEAEKAFVKVLDVDPECAMAYWGVAMSIYHAAWFPPQEDDLVRAAKILEVAEPIAKNSREKDYLDAIGAYYKDWDKTDHKTRAKNYEQKMEQMYTKYKDDTESAIFYALALYSTRDRSGKEYINEKKAGEILKSISLDQPDHPGVAHYTIHNYDNPELAHLALPTARRYADIAPGSSHAQHMPSHIFTRLGFWEESIQSNINSMSAAQCYAEQTKIDGIWFEEVHAMDYLTYAYLQQGNNAKANELYQHLLSMKKLTPLKALYNFGAIPARIFLENKDWINAAQIRQHPSNVDWENFPWEIAITHFARVLGAVHTKDIESAERDLNILRSLHQQIVDRNDQYNAKQVLVQIKASEAWIYFGKGENDMAISLMHEASVMEDNIGKHPVTPGEVLPARELLGDMFLILNKPKEALEAYELDLGSRPNRFNGICGAAVSAKNMGDQEKAKMYFNSLLKLSEGSNSDRLEIKEANAFISAISEF